MRKVISRVSAKYFFPDVAKSEQLQDYERVIGYWLSSFVRSKFGVPVALSIEETKQMADWCLYLGDAFPEATQRIKQMPLKNVFSYGITSKLVTNPVLDKFPKEACGYLNVILKAEEYPHLRDELLTFHGKFKATIAQTSEFHEFEELLYLRGWTK